MNDSAAVFCSDIITQDGHECALVIEVCEIVEQRMIAKSCQILSLVGLEDLVLALFLVVGSESCLAQDVLVTALLVQDLHIVDIRTQSQCQVGRQCPRSCGPCKEIGIFAVAQSEANRDGGISYVLVAAEVDFHV